MSSDPAMGEYFPEASSNEGAAERNQNLPGLGGLYNSRNLQTYHYAGNNPLKYTDPTGRYLHIQGSRDPESEAEARVVVAAMNADSTQEFDVQYDSYTKSWRVIVKKDSTETPAPTPPDPDTMSEAEYEKAKAEYDKAKAEYDEKKAYTDGIKRRIASKDQYTIKISDRVQVGQMLNSGWLSISSSAVDEASGEDGNNERLRDELKEILPPSLSRGNNSVRDGLGGRSKDPYSEKEARERDAFRNQDGSMRKGIGVPNPNEPIFK